MEVKLVESRIKTFEGEFREYKIKPKDVDDLAGLPPEEFERRLRERFHIPDNLPYTGADVDGANEISFNFGMNPDVR
jgi:hypothetical protein